MARFVLSYLTEIWVKTTKHFHRRAWYRFQKLSAFSWYHVNISQYYCFKGIFDYKMQLWWSHCM